MKHQIKESCICLRISHWKGGIHQTISAAQIMSGVVTPFEGDQWAVQETCHSCTGHWQHCFGLLIWLFWDNGVGCVEILYWLDICNIIYQILLSFKKNRWYKLWVCCFLIVESHQLVFLQIGVFISLKFLIDLVQISVWSVSWLGFNEIISHALYSL